MAESEGVQLVKNDGTGNFGLYRPEENHIETYIGDDRHTVHGDYLGVNWHPAEERELTESIQADISEVRGDIEELRGRDLTDEQEQELDRLESRLKSRENILRVCKEVGDGS